MDPRGLEIKEKIKASALDIFAYFIEPKLMNGWLDTAKTIEPRQEGEYSFGGSYTFPHGNDVTGEILAFQPPHRLVFSWPMEKTLTRTSIFLDEKKEGTTVLISHDDLPNNLHPYFIENAWIIYMTNLRLLIETKRGGLRFDYQGPSPTNCKLRINISASPERIFQALMDPEELNQWIATEAQVEKKPGGIYNWGWEQHGPISISTINNNQSLILNWRHKTFESLLVWELMPQNHERTQVRLLHMNLPEQDSRLYHQGWTATLNLLRVFVETGEAQTHRTHI